MNTSIVGRLSGVCLVFAAGVLGAGAMSGQGVPPSASRPWHSAGEEQLRRQFTEGRPASWTLEPERVYTLSELIDLAERHNPETRAAWERARIRADEVGIARAAYYPTLVASVYGASIRQPALIGEFLHRQTIALFSPTLHVEYLIFDLGGRSGTLDVAKANLLIQDLEFNDTHRRLIYQVASAYFGLLSALGQKQAAEVSLRNAETVEAEAEGRLANGLSTRPDVLETTAARVQADYDLQATIGAEQISHAELATSMGLGTGTQFQVQSIADITLPTAAADSLSDEVERAFQQRPELLANLARIRSCEGELKHARAVYFPAVRFAGDGGLSRGYGQQDLYPGHYGEGESWSVGLRLNWTMFNGLEREKRVAAAKEQKGAAEADLAAMHDHIEQEVFTSYTNLRTALRQQVAASALLTATSQSYESARQSYSLGLRSQLDVTSAQKSLAQARFEDVSARSRLLLQVADLAFRTGDMIQSQALAGKP